MNPLLSIIIVDYNAFTQLMPCLESIKKELLEVNYEIIIIDNASSSNHLHEYAAIDSQIQTFRLDENRGFGGGNNFGVKAAKGEYLLLLNPDTLMVDGSILQMINFAQQHKEIGIIGAKLFADNSAQAQEEQDYYGDFPTLKSLLSRNNHRRIRQNDGFLEAERITGACMLIKKSIFEKVGGFDANFFMYFEDTDLCQKVYGLGLKNIILNNTHLVHLGGKSQNNQKQKKLQYDRSQDYYFKKHYGTIQALIMRILRVPYRLLIRNS